MNKKLFKGALVLFASVLMAVSCSNNSTAGGEDGNGGSSNENNGNSGTQVTEIKKSDIENYIKALGTTEAVTGEIFNFSKAVTTDLASVTLTGESGTGNVSATDVKAKIEKLVTAKAGTTTKFTVSVGAPSGSSTTRDYKLTFTAAKNHKFESTLKPNDNKVEVTVKLTLSGNDWA